MEADKILADVQFKLLRTDSIEGTYALIASAVRDVIGDGIVAAIRLNDSNNTMQFVTCVGLGTMLDKILGVFGNDPTKEAKSLKEMSKEQYRRYSCGTLELVPGGIFELMAGLSPKVICDTAQKLMQIKDVYTVGVIQGEIPLGGLVILARTDIACHKSAIELIVNQAAFIIQRKRAEEALRKSEENYRIVADFTNDWEYWIAPDGKYLYMSPSCERITGYRREEFLHDSTLMNKLVHPDDVDSFVNHINSNDETGRNQECQEIDFRIITKSSKERWISHVCTKVYDHDNVYLGRRASNRDITERKQRENESLEIKEFLDSVAGFSFTKDLDLKYVSANRPFCDLLKIPYNKIQGMTDYDIFPADLADKYIKDDKRVIETAEPLTIEEVTINSNTNQRFIVQTRKFPRFDKKGIVTGVYGMGYDITALKQAEHAIREREELSRLIYNATKDQIYSYDCNNRFTSANRQLCEYLRLKPTDIIGKRYWELGFPDDKCREWDELHRQVYLKGSIVKVVCTLMPDGTNHYFEVNLSVVKDDTGTVIGIAGVNRDITERKQAEDALRANEDLHSKMISNIGDVIVVIDQNGINRYKSPNIEKYFGWKPEDVIGCSAFDNVHPEDLERGQAFIGALALTPNASGTTEVRYRCKDGSYKWIEITIVNLLHDSSINGFLGNYQDITDRKRMEEELHKTQKLESLGLLAGGIAHDFNNLMGGIFGYIDMASEETKEVKVTSYLSKAMNTIDRARALTQQLLTFAKGGAPIQQIGSLFPFVQETAQFALSGANVSCQFDIPNDLWSSNFDKNQIGQVIDNIIINAQQAMPVGGTIELSARNIALSENEHPLLKKGEYVKISIIDTGIGIQKEHLSRIFDPFFTTKPKGHGLGLATCYSIINRHGGCIDVESEPGKGSTFKVYLPASTETASSMSKNTAKMHTGSGTFLIMDDEEVMRDTIGDMLESLGYTVISKENGKDTIDFFATETKANRTIAGMIFDLTVPGGMGGKEAVEIIRKTNTDIPAFVASGYADDPVMKNPTEYGFTASICKPFRKTELSEMLNRHMKPMK